MSLLTTWIAHRTELMGLDGRTEVARLSGISLQIVNDLYESGTLADWDRSTKRKLAWALKVSLGDILDLDCGDSEWIEDDRIIEYSMAGAHGSATLRDDMPPEPVDFPKPEGTPEIGWVYGECRAEIDQAWDEEYGPRIPVRYKGRPLAFALRHPEGGHVVLDLVPMFRFSQSAMAMVQTGDFADRCFYGYLTINEQKRTAKLCADGQYKGDAVEIDPSQVVRMAKLVERRREAVAV